MPDIAYVPRGRGIGTGIGGQPTAQNTFGNARALGPRSTGLKIGQPAESVYQPFQRGCQARPEKFDIGDRRLKPVEQEMPGAQRRARRRIARQRIGNSRGQPGRNPLAKRIERARTQANAIGHADQAFAGADLRG